MLIEMSISNFRSFREKQTFSMVAAPRLHKRNNVFKPVVIGEKFPDLLKVAVIYGPNASGKSNLLRALEAVRKIASRSPSSGDSVLPVSAFKFDPDLEEQPSLFELHFIHEGVRYYFELAATSARIMKEKLVFFLKGVETLLYEREYIGGVDKYLYGEKLQGGEDVFETWRKLTPPGLLFLSQAVANSNEEFLQLAQPLGWLRKGTFPIMKGMRSLTIASQKLAEEGEVHASEIAEFLRNFDVPIAGIKVKPAGASTVVENQTEDKGADDESTNALKDLKNTTILTHRTALGDAEIRFHDESEGTKNLIGFWLPWVIRGYEKNPARVMFVDELDSSLHPLIVAALVKKHLDSVVDTQLIFTTHDTHLMDSKLLRRDQIWITERDANGATQLRSVHDFEGREGEDVEKRYFEGRYRGLPFVNKR